MKVAAILSKYFLVKYMPFALPLRRRLLVGLCYGLLTATSCSVPGQSAAQLPTTAGPVTYNITTRQLKNNHLPEAFFN